MKNIRDFYRDINDFKKGYHPRIDIRVVKDKKGDLVTGSHSILARSRNISLSCSMHMGLVMLGKGKFIQQNQQCLSRMPLSRRWLLKS